MPKELDAIITHLLSPSEEKSVADPHWNVTSVGRNDVWRIVRLNKNRETFYLKRYTEKASFERELFGHHIAHEIAKHSNRYVTASILETISKANALLTSEITGNCFDSFVRKAYRIDKNPFFRSAARLELKSDSRKSSYG